MNEHPHLRFLRIAALVLAAVLTVAACGGDDDDGTTAAGDSSAPADDGSAPADDGEGDDDATPPGAAGGGGATVSIGGAESFEFEEELVCIAMGGAVSGTFRNDEGVEVSIDVPPEDWETSGEDWDPPSLTLRDERDESNWRIFEAGSEVAATYPGTAAEQAVITNFSVDGSQATGNGMAIDTYAITRSNAEGGEAPQAVPVTFGFECG